jgi:replicative DNA helicase
VNAPMIRWEAAQQQQRAMPHNVEMEQGLIGAVLLNNDSFLRVSGIVAAEHFHEEIHQSIWSVMAAQISKGQVANPITLKTYLGDPELAPGKKLVAYLAGLASDAPTGRSSAESYAKTVRDLYLRREVIAMAEKAAAIAYDAPVEATAETIFADVERGLETLRPAVQKEDDGFCDFGHVPSDEVYDAYQRQAGVVGLSTGLSRLDDVLNGLQNSDLIIGAGRPGTGKTSWATGVAVSVAKYVRARRADGVDLGPVGFFSLEMSRKQLKTRVIADIASVSARKLLRGEGSNEEMTAYANAERELADLPLTIDQTGALSISSLKLRARALKKRRGLSLLVIDYLQLITVGEKKGRDNNRTQEVTEITSGLKALAKELDIPIIALSQLSRKVEERDDKRPMLSDLRESGSIEQDADSVLFIYREEYYLQNAKPREEGEAMGRWYGLMKRWEGIAEIIVAKNRHGSVGTVELGFEGEFTRFTNEPPWRSPDPEEARKAAKHVRLTAHGEALRDILKELAVSIGRRPTIQERDHKPALPAGAMLIDRERVKEVFRERVVVDLNETEARSKMQAAADNLRLAKLTANYTNPDKQNFIYLVELIAE